MNSTNYNINLLKKICTLVICYNTVYCCMLYLTILRISNYLLIGFEAILHCSEGSIDTANLFNKPW